jgi:UDP-N-acetylglucosamine 2-epimerase
MLKVMTIVGTRPEIIRLSRVIEKMDSIFDHTFVHTGQNYDYELNEVFFSDLGIRKPDVFLQAAGTTAAETIGNIIIEADKALDKFQPEAILILGDTNSSLVAIPAKRRKIVIFHMEAGNRCFDFRVPEELNRRIVDHVSDINLTYSQIAREYLLREGFPADQIIKTGSPMREVLKHYSKGIGESAILEDLGLLFNDYFLVSTHREENVDSPKNLSKILNMLNALAERYDKKIIVSTHPRTRARLKSMDFKAHHLISFVKPFGFFDYVKLQMSAYCVLSDSGTITEESSILNFPALNMREVHERPEGFEESAVMMVGLELERVTQALQIIEEQLRGDERTLQMVADYRGDNVSEKIVRIILSYTDFIKRKTWKVDSN